MYYSDNNSHDIIILQPINPLTPSITPRSPESYRSESRVVHIIDYNTRTFTTHNH